MQTIVSDGFLILGALLMLIASVGMLRMPDLFLRMSTSTKAATLGVALVMIAMIIHFGELGVTARAVSIIVFIMLTAPISAHMIARAAYFTGVQLWSKTIVDELRHQYDLESHTLKSKLPQRGSENT